MTRLIEQGNSQLPPRWILAEHGLVARQEVSKPPGQTTRVESMELTETAERAADDPRRYSAGASGRAKGLPSASDDRLPGSMSRNRASNPQSVPGIVSVRSPIGRSSAPSTATHRPSSRRRSRFRWSDGAALTAGDYAVPTMPSSSPRAAG